MRPNPPERERSPANQAWRLLVAAFVAIVFAGHGMAQAPASDTGAAPAALSAEDLDALVGRIALYPDDLVAIILPGATFPLQIVQADRFLDKRKVDPKLPIDEKWDDSVKALVNYPDVVKMMSGDLDWTSALGEAVVADQGAVLEAIQAFRRRAQAAGNLKSNDKQVVEVEKQTIAIVPANPEVIYVPQYNPTTVVVAGAPAWGYYPTPYPVYYYPYAPGAAFATGLIWGAAIGAAWGGGRWGCNWGGGDININRNTNINTGNINRGNVNRGNASTRPAGGGTAWKSDKRPGQVSGATGRTNAAGSRVGDAGRGGGGFSNTSANRPSSGSFGGGAGAGANRPSTQQGGGVGAANRAGSASASPRDNFGGSGASRGGYSGSGMSGYGSGRQTSMDSSRGASSRGSMSSGASRSTPSGGGARAGGGGGGRGGGGGGGRGGGGRR